MKKSKKREVDIVTSDDIKIYYTGKFQDFTARYIIKQVSFLSNPRSLCQQWLRWKNRVSEVSVAITIVKRE